MGEAVADKAEVEQAPPKEDLEARSSWAGVGVLDLMQEGLQILGYDWRYLYVNRAAAEHGRRSQQELLSGTLVQLYPGIETTPLFAALSRCMHERAPECFDNEFVFQDGSRRWFELRIEPVPEGILILSIDISRRRELEAGLALTQKMEALGRLAGGIAHDFNNILTVIVHSAEFVARAIPANHASQTDLREILDVSDRGAKMVRQLLALSRQQLRDARPLPVNDAMSDLLPILRRLVSDAVSIDFVPDPKNPAIRIDQNHLTQMMLNLVGNARDAIASRGAIWISCATIDCRLASEKFSYVLDQAPEYVRISVSDNGCGMDEATVARVFEPFFTTKQQGKGTGLGLAATHGIVKQNDGEIRVTSTPDQGTTFEMYFPRVKLAAEARPAFAPTVAVKGGREVVLVVDDDPTICTLCSRTLAKLGYTVMQADGPTEALRFVSRYSGPIDLVLSDVAMPEMSGTALCRQLRAARPSLRALLMSGYVDPERHPDVDPAQVLSKPFTQNQLALRVRAALDDAAERV